MLIVLALIAAIVVAGAAFMLVQAKRFGGIKAAFSGDLKEQRQRLAAARARARSLAKARDAELGAARQSLEKATASRDSRIATLQDRAAYLENPGAGRKIAGVKDVRLYEHAVEIGGRMIALHGAQARVETTAESAALYVTDAQGSSVLRSFDTTFRDTGSAKVERGYDYDTITQKQKRDFTPEMIMQLANAINNAVIAEGRFREELPAMREATAAELSAEIANTAEVDATATLLNQLQAGSDTLQALRAAEAELAELEQRWRAAVAGTKASAPTEGAQPALS